MVVDEASLRICRPQPPEPGVACQLPATDPAAALTRRPRNPHAHRDAVRHRNRPRRQRTPTPTPHSLSHAYTDAHRHGLPRHRTRADRGARRAGPALRTDQQPVAAGQLRPGRALAGRAAGRAAGRGPGGPGHGLRQPQHALPGHERRACSAPMPAASGSSCTPCAPTRCRWNTAGPPRCGLRPTGATTSAAA